jgi:hypothetical protein
VTSQIGAQAKLARFLSHKFHCVPDSGFQEQLSEIGLQAHRDIVLQNQDDK